MTLEPDWASDGPEWDDAHEAVIRDLVGAGYSESEAEDMADDWTVEAWLEDGRANAEAEAADIRIKARKEGW